MSGAAQAFRKHADAGGVDAVVVANKYAHGDFKRMPASSAERSFSYITPPFFSLTVR